MRQFPTRFPTRFPTTFPASGRRVSDVERKQSCRDTTAREEIRVLEGKNAALEDKLKELRDEFEALKEALLPAAAGHHGLANTRD